MVINEPHQQDFSLIVLTVLKITRNEVVHYAIKATSCNEKLNGNLS